MRDPSRFRNPGRLEDGVAGSCRHFFRPVVIHTIEPGPASLAVVADRALLLDERETVRLQQPDEFAEFHGSLQVGLTGKHWPATGHVVRLKWPFLELLTRRRRGPAGTRARRPPRSRAERRRTGRP